ncbi:MAG: Uncharacterized protein Greene101449_129 [Candidatus Peregrinibacteria bacterium Greene1014_49]|nr:MAG: Uncharacterized protein Greene101449_129 [Candidatus Peregrinibacteria bacterium Greene1014_49]
MTNRKLVLGLMVANAGFVFGTAALGSPANLLGALSFFGTDATERLAEFDDDNNSIPDLVDGLGILNAFQSIPQIFGPLFGQPAYVPGMIRLDPDFFMPSGHEAAPVIMEEMESNFDVVEPLWSDEEIRSSNEFEGGDAEPGVYLVPSVSRSPSSSLPATLVMPPPQSAPSTNSAPAASTPSTSASVSSTSTEDSASSPTAAETAGDAATSDSTSVSSTATAEICTNGADDDADGLTDCDDDNCMSDAGCFINPSSTSSVEQCTNAVDDDGDGLVDCDDVGCMSDPACVSFSTPSF